MAGAVDLLGRKQGLPPAISGHNNYWMPYENHRPVWVCRGLRVPLAEAWTRAKHYD